MEPRLKNIIIKEINPSLKEKFGYRSLYMGPKIEKIVLNMGLGLDGNDSKIVNSCQDDLASITGQKPVVTKFRKSIANFKTRKNTNSGLKVRILSGKDKKKEGEVIEIDRPNNRAKVKEINMVKKHVKTTKEKKGGIISKESFIHISNLKLIDEKIKIKKSGVKK